MKKKRNDKPLTSNRQDGKERERPRAKLSNLRGMITTKLRRMTDCVERTMRLINFQFESNSKKVSQSIDLNTAEMHDELD